MMLHPQIIEKEGKKEFVVLPYEEFLQLQEQVADYEDLKDLRYAKDEERDAPTTPLSEVKKHLKYEA
jgi:PHD/YefM family antitoxin component YafN of YafNO toxin-antitoxin module